MNNKNKILVGCLALLLVLSVGYALFGETVTINGTATAKGSFDISYECEIVTTEIEDTGIYTTGGTGTCDTTSDVIKTTSTLNKPTDTVVYKITLTNAGTIAAKLNTITTPNNTDNVDTYTSGDSLYFDSSTGFAGHFMYVPEGGTFEDDVVVSETAIENLGITVQPQGKLVFYIVHLITDLDPQPVLPTDGATLNYNVSLGFEQVAVQ